MIMIYGVSQILRPKIDVSGCRQVWCPAEAHPAPAQCLASAGESQLEVHSREPSQGQPHTAEERRGDGGLRMRCHLQVLPPE